LTTSVVGTATRHALHCQLSGIADDCRERLDSTCLADERSLSAEIESAALRLKSSPYRKPYKPRAWVNIAPTRKRDISEAKVYPSVIARIQNRIDGTFAAKASVESAHL
jgi:hypothetical protein